MAFLHVYMYMCMGMCVPCHMWKSQDNLWELLIPSFQSCESQDGTQSWWQVSSLAEPTCQPTTVIFKKWYFFLHIIFAPKALRSPPFLFIQTHLRTKILLLSLQDSLLSQTDLNQSVLSVEGWGNAPSPGGCVSVKAHFRLGSPMHPNIY